MILAFNDKPLSGIDDLHRLLTDGVIDVRCQLTILRRTEKVTVSIVPEESFPVSR